MESVYLTDPGPSSSMSQPSLRNRGIMVAAFPLHGLRHEASNAGERAAKKASRQQVLMQELSLIALLGILLNTHHGVAWM
ncbi:hypothetical protein CEXT_225061 [Caerostris extrusa]|uniref:Uncharacterized protein n=1 Tax=Caerostris extrusa TaxID=172846 RepID=A0AAV4VEN7_CAEEX|nr:hypothetical protein CEXT_225061 [Caerostris extrusa]